MMSRLLAIQHRSIVFPASLLLQVARVCAQCGKPEMFFSEALVAQGEYYQGTSCHVDMGLAPIIPGWDFLK